MFTDAQLKKLIFPLMVEQALVVLVGMVDTVMVSSLGEAAVSGVSLIDMISVVIINLFLQWQPAVQWCVPSCWGQKNAAKPVALPTS